MNTKILFGLFVAVAAVQLAVPVSQIWKHEDILRTGTVYKFKTAPVDPYDAFRGRYVALRFEQDHASLRGTNQVPYRTKAFAAIEEGADGFAVVRELTTVAPATGDFVKVETSYPGWGSNAGTVFFNLPFSRYYMEETRAPQAETAYREHNRRGKQDAYVVVRVKDGTGVLEELYITGVPVREFLRQHPSTK